MRLVGAVRLDSECILPVGWWCPTLGQAFIQVCHALDQVMEGRRRSSRAVPIQLHQHGSDPGQHYIGVFVHALSVLVAALTAYLPFREAGADRLRFSHGNATFQTLQPMTSRPIRWE